MKTIVLSLIAASFLAAQQPSRRFDTSDPGHGIEKRLTSSLGLTATQTNKVHTILSERDVIAKGSREQMLALNQSLTAAIKAGNDDQIERISQEIATQHQKQTSLHAHSMAKIYAALTPDQQAKVGPNLEMLLGPRAGFGGGPGSGPGLRRGPRPPAPAVQ
jgi:Spy/CpxP family protein refolding chaperone